MRQERALRTRRAILDAAASVFDERGYEAATIGEVLARAGVTKGLCIFIFRRSGRWRRGCWGSSLRGLCWRRG
ncbi:TetR family transcriptional regulator [Streptomyces sp. RLB1-33]|nr:helix-turn-helix domain-containing protein [Streptomyces sp. RLB1-33]